jgi:hypothetical protein
MKVMVADKKKIGNVRKCHKGETPNPRFQYGIRTLHHPSGRIRCGFRSPMVTNLGHILS